MRTRLLAIPVALFLAATLWASCIPAEQGPRRPEFRLPKVGGGELVLSEFRGQILYVDFWATWCGPCVKAIPELNELHAEYKDRGFSVVGVSVDDLTLEQVAHFAENEKVSYPVALGPESVMAAFGPVQGLPTGYLLDREGLVRRRFLGQLPIAALRISIEALLEEGKPTP